MNNSRGILTLDVQQRAVSTRRSVPSASTSTQYSIRHRGRFWEVRDASGELVCLTVYKRGAEEVIRRLHT